MASVIYLRGRNWRLRQGDDGKGRDLSKRIHSGWKTGGTEEKLADLNAYWLSTHETKSLRPGDLRCTILARQSFGFLPLCEWVCVHSTEVDVWRPGQQRLPSVPGLGHLPSGPHHLLSGIHPDSGSAGCWYDNNTQPKKTKKNKTQNKSEWSVTQFTEHCSKNKVQIVRIKTQNCVSAVTASDNVLKEI